MIMGASLASAYIVAVKKQTVSGGSKEPTEAAEDPNIVSFSRL